MAGQSAVALADPTGSDAATVDHKEHFYGWHPREEIDSGEYVTSDYDFTKPQAELITKNQNPVGHPFDSKERYSWPGARISHKCAMWALAKPTPEPGERACNRNKPAPRVKVISGASPPAA